MSAALNLGPSMQTRAWDDLTLLASEYFWLKRQRQELVLAADRSKRLRKIAKVLGEACRLFDEAKQDELIEDLYSAWYDQNVNNDTVPEGPLDARSLPRTSLMKFLRLCPHLKPRLVSRAMTSFRRQDDRRVQFYPWMSSTPWQHVYQERTGLKAGAGRPFSNSLEFVGAFATA